MTIMLTILINYQGTQEEEASEDSRRFCVRDTVRTTPHHHHRVVSPIDLRARRNKYSTYDRRKDARRSDTRYHPLQNTARQ